jgi:Bacterial translation initiation factor IF-2 associated region.
MKTKMQLLAHLRKRHGKDEGEVEGSLKRVTLKRRTVSELKQASVPGSTTKTISVEVRKQKTYIKRSEIVDTDEQRNLELAKQTLNEQIAQQAASLLPVEELVKTEEVVLEAEAQKKETVVDSESIIAVAAVEQKEVGVVASSAIDTASPSRTGSLPAETLPPSPVAEGESEDLSDKEEKKIAHEKAVKAKESPEARKNNTKRSSP